MNLAPYIDHTLLKPEATSQQIQQVIQEALQHQFAGVCVNSSHIEKVSQGLKGSSVLSVAVIGFPLGAMSTDSKAFEASYCAKHGAQEIDMVLNIGALKDKNYELVLKDIEAVVQAAKPAKVKVIIETALLTIEEKIKACELSAQANAHFVKTCTGFGGGGATVEDIQLMRKTVGPNIGVKASGGIKSIELAKALIEAGANRLGTSSGVALINHQTPTQGSY